MADNIKIVGNILDTTLVSRYLDEDIRLIQSSKLQENFGGTGDYIEYYAYDAANNLLNTNYNYLSYKLPPSVGLTPTTVPSPNIAGNIQTENVGIESTLSTPTSSLFPIIEIDPIKDLQDLGYSSGEFKVQYNLFQNKVSDYINEALFIKEISSDRTEIRLASTTLTNEEIESAANALIDEMNNSTYYVDYLLNFGNNEQYVAVNVFLNRAIEGYEILFKLYQPLPLSVQEKQTLWVVEEKVTPYVFDINLDRLVTPAPPPTLRGPNFDIEIPNNGTVSTAYNTYNNLVMGLQSLQSSSYHRIINLIATQSININVDYSVSESSDFGNFVFFGSAYQRTSNFYTKAKQIEDYNNLITKYTPYTATTASLLTEINKYSSSITNIISQFDGYESYLYFESSSYAWPKSGSLKPFKLLSTGSATVLSWYSTLTGSALNYDANNYDNLEYAIPTYLKDDENNAPFLLFLNMIGYYFDNIWIYLKAITDLNVANNNLNYGISRDLVYERLKSLGLHLYNSQAGEDLNQFLVGANTGSSVFPYPTTSSGNDFTITGSYLNNIPRKDLVSELYKRIYHNLPLLLKSKGTVEGLDHLITVFGIPNQTYYTVGRNTFYTATGSNSTSSILNVKEFGGSTKSNLINGYNNDKVRIVSNTITGSILSPLLSFQTFPTASNEFRENDMHYVDISFSPQNQIDTYAANAIAATNATFSLDDLIGDPRQQYSPSYTDLDAQRKLYFQTGVSGYAPFTGSALDYNGFIRLIEYFDNALFKMFVDFVPERASLSTGVTFNSPVLERNKAVYANPSNSTTQSNQTAQYDIADITPLYGTFYNALSSSNNTMGWYDGELSGSIIDINQYFEGNPNPYLDNWDVWNAQHSPSQSINLNSFLHSDWNVLLNNVSASILSTKRKKLEYKAGNFLPTSSILVPVELQDSYLTLRSYNTSRYDGCKTISLKYNTYTSASGDYAGDYSFGKTAAIDHYVRKIGIFTQIQSSSFLPQRNPVSLKYFIDEFGNLTELNQLNKNWQDVQRTFIMGDVATVAQFDNRKYSNQRQTDGDKPIFDSGYSYHPILYGSGQDARLYFVGVTPSSYRGVLENSGSLFITGSSDLSHPISGGIVTNLFNLKVEGDSYTSIGGPGGGAYNSYPSYSVQEAATHNIEVSFDLIAESLSVADISFTCSLYSGSSGNQLISSSIIDFAWASSSPVTASTFAFIVDIMTNPRVSSGRAVGTPVVSGKAITLPYGGTYPAGHTWYYYGDLWTGYNPSGPSVSDLVSDLYSPTVASFPVSLLPVDFLAPPNTIFYGFNNSATLYQVTNLNAANLGAEVSQSVNFNVSNKYLRENEKIRVELTVAPGTSGPVTASISSGNFAVYSLSTLVGNYPFTSREYFLQYGFRGVAGFNNQLVLSKELGSFYGGDYRLIPSYNSASVTYNNSLYESYGPVDYPFLLKPEDIFVAYDNDGNYFESRIKSISPGRSFAKFTLDYGLLIRLMDDIPDSIYNGMTQLASNPNVKFLFLTRVEDETIAYLTFQKRPGPTSYGFLVPENLSPEVLAQIDTITKQAKQKLLSDQPIVVESVGGGTF